VHVQWLLKFVREELSLLLLLQELLLKKVYFSLQIWDALGLGLSVNQLSLKGGDLVDELLDLLLLLVIVDVTLVESGLLDLDLLVEVMELLISLDELGGEDISLIHDHFVVFLLLGLLSLSLLNDILQPANIVLLSLNHLVG